MATSILASVVLAATTTIGSAIVVNDGAELRNAPREPALRQAVLRAGEIVEVRGERLDHLLVWDHQRERGGYVRASQLRRTSWRPEEAADTLAVLRHVQQQPGQESLAIGLAAAWLQQADGALVRGPQGMQALDALGAAAQRLAERASSRQPVSASAQAALAAQMEVAARHGVRFVSWEHEGRMQVCYDGEAHRLVMQHAVDATLRAHAALALTDPDCVNPSMRAAERAELDHAQARWLDGVDTAALAPFLANRVHLRRAGLGADMAFRLARAADGPSAVQAQVAAGRAFARVRKTELTDGDWRAWNDAAMRVNASRWALASTNLDDLAPSATRSLPVRVGATVTPARAGMRGSASADPRRPVLRVEPTAQGEQCLLLLDPAGEAARPLARRCTWGLVWSASASFNREGNAIAVAVQPLAGWRELWLLRREAQGWTVRVIPPGEVTPGMGYAEFAGWVPGGRQMLLAREARGDGRYARRFEVLDLRTLATVRQGPDPAALGAFRRWQDARWVAESVSVR